MDIPTPPTERRRGSISNLIRPKKAKKDKGDKSATSSVTGSSDPSSDQQLDLRRTSSDGQSPFERLKDRVRSRDDGGGSGRRLSVRLPGNRRRSKQQNGKDGIQDVVDTALPPGRGANGSNIFGTSKSEDSLEHSASISSSLLTEDSDPGPRSTRPPITTRDSHAGYLTLSSPLIPAESIDTSQEKQPAIESVQSLDTLATKKADTLAAPSLVKRSTSPVGRLKEALTPSRKSSNTSLREDSKQSKSGKGGGGGVVVEGDKEETLPQPPQPIAKTINDSERSNAGSNSANARPKTPQNIITKNLPSTPPGRLGDTPTTLVTPPTPTDPKHNISTQSTPKAGSKGSPPASLSTRRTRSNSIPPSKLSNSIAPPLTPTIEEIKTPGGSLTTTQNPTGTSGFFGSFFSATQNAANQLTNSILNPSLISGQRSRSGTGPDQAEKTGQAGGEEVILSESASTEETTASDSPQEKRQLAVETLGSGNLSLSHLGIADAPLEPAIKLTKSDMSDSTATNGTVVQTEEVLATAEDDAAAKAISAAYTNGDKVGGTGAEKAERPLSIAGLSDPGIQTPGRAQSVFNEESGIRRTGSIRSRVSERRKRRHRGSSATTGNTIAAAISASTAALANPQLNPGPKLTGFAVANPKRNRDFHQLFRSVPEDDYLIEDYSAALQRDILLQGRLYISEGHVCFSSNILGWVTNLVISFDEIVSVEKKSTAVIFPNAIVVQTLHARNVFASLVSRDTTYDLLINIWKISHPNLKSSLNGVTLDDAGGTGDKTEKAGSIVPSDGEDDSLDESEDDVYDEDAEEEEGDGSFAGEAGDANGVDATGADDENGGTRKTSAAVIGATVAGGAAKVIDAVEAVVAGATASADYPGPQSHEATACGDEGAHLEKLLIDTTIPAPLGKVYSMMFGPASGTWMRRWLIDDQKSMDLQLEDDKKGLDDSKKSMNYSYIKPLTGSIGPKQTKCVISQTLEQFDLEKAVTVSCATQNPDVPSGNIFVVKTRYCLMWGPGNSTRMIANCTIEWSGKSWLKGPIEKAANDGQNQYVKDLITALRAAVVAKASTPKSLTKGLKGAKKRGKKEADIAVDQDAVAIVGTAGTPTIQRNDPNWGLFEPLHGLLGPVVDLVGGTRLLVGILCIMVFWMWIRQPAVPGDVGLFGAGRMSPARMAAYEEMWRREEGELWRWLESRVGSDGVGGAGDRIWESLKEKERKDVASDMREREVEEAIKVTKERLQVLEDVVRRRKDRDRE
ncbi:hypothetical protein NA57DRAFT_74551 [Rhizodiscina lignyota]|uniref:VASt domain-containing protein n=1 Tax=Rhizodiscina lignyota TaxID=1504668 RepID=A0A9P4IKE9_9PEZI|nr:hypothetical protein NA57DRAFT_74551 [Rhizodiscina lignyota]